MRRTLITAAMVASLALAGCGGSEEVASDDAAGTPPVAGMCLPEAPDCVDTVEPGGEVETGGDEFPVEQAEAAAEALLGTVEADLASDVRVARRGEETFFLTEDHRPGRVTVELDQHDDVYVVTAVTLELPDGPVTFRQ